MKKLLIGILSVLLLSACSNSEKVLVSGGDEIIINKEKENVTKQDLFTSMQNNDYSAIIINKLIAKVSQSEGIDLEEVEKQADERLEMMEQTYGSYYSQLEYYYGGKDALKENIVASICSEELANQYIDLNFDQYADENKPVKMQLAYFSDLDTANKVIEEVNAGKDFTEVVSSNGYSSDASAKVYLDSDSLAIEIKEYLNADTTKIGLSDIINTSTTTTDSTGNEVAETRYYVINIIDRDASNFKDEFIETLLNKFELADAINYFFGKHDIQFYDQRTYDLVSSQYESLK